MRAICVLVTASLLAACAPSVGAWRADGTGIGTGVGADPATRTAQPRSAHRDDDRGDDRLDDGDEVVGCLGQAVVIGGVAAVIYLTRFRGRGGGGGDGEVAASTRAPGAASGAEVPPAAAAIVEAAPIADGGFRRCGAICGEGAVPAVDAR